MANPLSVIIVDDQAPFRLAAKAVLRRMEGFELVGQAENGVQAIALAHELHPDLVLMDINMPEMGGIEATRMIMAERPETVVILCSTYGVSDLPPEAATSGARAYVHKEQLEAKTLRRLWDERDENGFRSSAD
ncbi:MAG: response regulator transcription factor [Acidimicrobiales bacterium]|jgi:pilus assembly protein CpaE